jgi:hypothetical protein
MNKEERLTELKLILEDLYSDYKEIEYNAKAPFSIYENRNPDFDTWTDKNCLSFDDWVKEDFSEEAEEYCELLKEK